MPLDLDALQLHYMNTGLHGDFGSRLRTPDGFSVSAWLSTVQAGRGSVWAYGQNSCTPDGQSQWHLTNTDGSANQSGAICIDHGDFADNGYLYYMLSTGVNDGTLKHACWTSKNAGSVGGGRDVRFYLNGVDLTASWVKSFDIDCTTAVNFTVGVPLGARKITGPSEFDHYTGKIEEFRLYTRALTPGEVMALFLGKGCDTVRGAHLRCHMPLDRGTRNLAANGVAGTLALTSGGTILPTFNATKLLPGCRKKVL